MGFGLSLHLPFEPGRVKWTVKAILIALLSCASVPAAHAQIVSVYGTFSPVHASNVQTGVATTTAGANSVQYTSFWSPAFGGGVTFNFFNLHVVKLGLDARGSTRPGTTGADTAEVSLRVGLQPPFLGLKPYVQGGVGYLATRTPNTSTNNGAATAGGATFRNQFATAGFHAGIDKPLIPFLDFRVIEIGYARALNSGITLGNTGNANIFSLGTGLVAHF